MPHLARKYFLALVGILLVSVFTACGTTPTTAAPTNAPATVASFRQPAHPPQLLPIRRLLSPPRPHPRPQAAPARRPPPAPPPTPHPKSSPPPTPSSPRSTATKNPVSSSIGATPRKNSVGPIYPRGLTNARVSCGAI